MRKTIAGVLLVSAFICNAVPSFGDALTDRGEALYKAKDFKNAGRYFAQSLQTNPINSRALYFSSLCLQGMGNTDAAKNGLQTIVQVFPTSPEAAMAKQALSGNWIVPPPLAAGASARSATTQTLGSLKSKSHAASAAHAVVGPKSSAGSAAVSAQGTTSDTSKTTVVKTTSTANTKTSEETTTQSVTGQPSTTTQSSTSTGNLIDSGIKVTPAN